MKMTLLHSAVLICAITLAAPAVAQDHSSHETMGAPAGDQSASSRAFAAANAKMHKDMAITFTGNADKDFVLGMIAHHQGAIDMAKVELEYGKDADIRKLAEGIIAAQEGEIKQMQDWLKNNGG